MRRKKLKGKYNDIKVSSLNKFISKNKLKLITISSFLVVLGTILLINSPKDNVFKSSYKKLLANNGIYTEEIKSIDITSDDYDEPGSFKVTKEAEWIDYGKAKLTINADSIMKEKNNNKKDIILVMDVSGSMDGEKLNKAKEDAIDLTNKILSDNKNKIGLITFDSNAEIVFNLTNDSYTIIGKINSLTTKGATNYNAALKKVDEILEGYKKQNNRDLIVLFLTDGNPCKDTPNEVSTYKILKEKYPSLTIQGIQYEMGSSITESLKNISDKQFNANIDTLGNVLVEASTNPIVFDEYIITDYIDTDYFEEPNEEDIKASIGSYELDGNKITWNLGDSYVTGNKASLTVNLTQKERYIDEEGFYPTNEKESIKYKLGKENETISSHDTPVLKNTYEVIYNANAPSGCIVETPESEKQTVNKVVTMKTPELSCNGYMFNGWGVKDSENIKYINKTSFKMPPRNVYINASWSKQSISKSMDGKIHEKSTLYKVLENEAKIRNGKAKEYTGEHADAYDRSGNEKIYHWYASSSANATEIKNKLNVIFGGFCWEMIRTTDTGGVKLVYNGIAENNQCLDTREQTIGYDTDSSDAVYASRLVDLSTDYYYSTDYIYDKSSDRFKLSGNIFFGHPTDNNLDDYLWKYTCMSQSIDGECQQLHLVDNRRITSNTKMHTILISKSAPFDTIGYSIMHDKRNSLSDFGYMNNIRYEYKDMNLNNDDEPIWYSMSSSLSRYAYSPYYTYNPETKKYKLLDDPSTPENDIITPAQCLQDGNCNEVLHGLYTCHSSNKNAECDATWFEYTINFISDGQYTYVPGGTFDDEYYVGDEIVDNGNNTYTVQNYRSFLKKEFLENKEYLIPGKYLCIGSNPCNSPIIIDSVTESDTYNQWVKGHKIPYVYANDFDYVLNEETNEYEYVLKDTDIASKITIDSYNNDDERLQHNHYTCFNTNGRCKNIYYIYDIAYHRAYYLTLSDGKSIEDALNEMLFAGDVNKNDSILKIAIDKWYEHNLKDYSSYLEDTVFCNNRSISKYGGWNPNGAFLTGGVSSSINFGTTSSLACPNETDRFSLNNPQARLKYPIALPTNVELMLLSNDNLRKANSGKGYQTISPYYYTDSYTNLYGVSNTGNPYSLASYVRPVISLKPNIEYSDGDGSKDHPYIIDTEGD